MKRFYLYFLILQITSCGDAKQNKYCRTWIVTSGGSTQQDIIFKDTVADSFIPLDSLTKPDTTFFRTCFAKPLNIWLTGNGSKNFYKITDLKSVLYKNNKIRLARCISSLDSNREDHIVSVLVLENVGIIFQSNPSMRSYYILEKMVDSRNNKVLIDNNYVKSIYLPNHAPLDAN